MTGKSLDCSPGARDGYDVSDQLLAALTRSKATHAWAARVLENHWHLPPEISREQERGIPATSRAWRNGRRRKVRMSLRGLCLVPDLGRGSRPCLSHPHS